MAMFQFLVFPVLVLSLISSATCKALDLKTFLRNTTTGTEPSFRFANRISKPLIGDDGKIYACSENNLFSFASKGTIARIIPLSYRCNVDIPPVSDGRGKVIYLIAEERILKVTPSDIVTSEPKVETLFSLNSTSEGSETIVGLSVSSLYSSVFITIRNRGLFAFYMWGQLRWSSGPMLYRFGYRQGCRKNITHCFFNTAPVVDQCEGTLYISNTEGQLYSLYIRQPHFRWIQDFSLVDKFLTITPGNNGRLFVAFPRKALLMALEVSTGNVLWQSTVGPLSMEDTLPIVDSNGWVSISSIDGYLYSFSPSGYLKKFLQKTASDSVAQVSPVLDCSGFAVYVSQTIMETKLIHNVGNYTYISGVNPQKLVVTLLAPATGTVYWIGTYPGDLSSFLSKTDLRYFASNERILLAFLSSGNQKLSWTCSQGESKFVYVDSDSERALLLFLLLQLVIIFMLAGIVRFCCVFWRKKRLQDHGLGKFLETRYSLHKKKRKIGKMISELEEKPVTNEVLEHLGELVKAKEGVEKKLTTSYSLGRDSVGSKRWSILPLYDGSSRGHSFRSAKKETVTIFRTLSSDDEHEDESTSGEGCISNRNSNETGRSNSSNEEKHIRSSSKGKEIIRDMPNVEYVAQGSGADHRQCEGILWRRKLFKRRTLSSTN
ncbi:putative quinoprotein alcohol dehydrogenase-like superfamily [Dioscorea sansibarensis]